MITSVCTICTRDEGSSYDRLCWYLYPWLDRRFFSDFCRCLGWMGGPLNSLLFRAVSCSNYLAALHAEVMQLAPLSSISCLPVISATAAGHCCGPQLVYPKISHVLPRRGNARLSCSSGWQIVAPMATVHRMYGGCGGFLSRPRCRARTNESYTTSTVPWK